MTQIKGIVGLPRNSNRRISSTLWIRGIHAWSIELWVRCLTQYECLFNSTCYGWGASLSEYKL
jgi:hypothetical protein